MCLTWGGACGAGDGDRTRIASLEGWNSAIELHPHGAVPWCHERRVSARSFTAGTARRRSRVHAQTERPGWASAAGGCGLNSGRHREASVVPIYSGLVGVGGYVTPAPRCGCHPAGGGTRGRGTWRRGVAQFGSASALGAEGQGFESPLPDHGRSSSRAWAVAWIVRAGCGGAQAPTRLAGVHCLARRDHAALSSVSFPRRHLLGAS